MSGPKQTANHPARADRGSAHSTGRARWGSVLFMAGVVSVDRGLHERYTVITAEGEFDLYSSPLLRQPLLDELQAGRPWLVVDLSTVTFLSSTALEVLVAAAKRSKAANGCLRLVAPSRQLLRLFELTDLIRFFEIYSSVAEALSSPSV